MADDKKELLEINVIVPFPKFKGDRIDADKRCYAGKTKEEKDANGKVIVKSKAITTNNKVRLSLPCPATDEESQKFYKVDLRVLVGMGVRQNSYSTNKTDIYLSEIGTKDIDVPGLTSLLTDDLPILPRERKASVTKDKAAKYDALMAKYDVSEEELAKILAHAGKDKK